MDEAKYAICLTEEDYKDVSQWISQKHKPLILQYTVLKHTCISVITIVRIMESTPFFEIAFFPDQFAREMSLIAGAHTKEVVQEPASTQALLYEY